MEARRILTIIKYNNKDISADISKYLKSISYTDNLSGEADDLQITLEDKAGLWQSTWIPGKRSTSRCNAAAKILANFVGVTTKFAFGDCLKSMK